MTGRSPRKIGLARALSKLGYCSRSQAGKLIRGGRVRLRGSICRDPEAAVNLEKDGIEVDDHRITSASKIYFVLNKPRGVVTTAADEKGRTTIYACLDPSLPWLAPVGRLDKASEGLLLLSNDSEWSARLLDPETHLDKTYHVQIGAVAHAALIESLTSGIKADDGEFLRVKRARILRHGKRNSWLEVILDEGKNRHIRRMLSQFGIDVLRLVRVAIGPLELGELRKGSFRELTAREKQLLDRSMRSGFV
jgi:23S rRNA pseudouridine2605 synthase